MSKRNHRLAQYYNNTTLPTVSTEGLLETIKGFFTGRYGDALTSKGAPNPLSKKAGSDATEWVRKFRKEIEQTYANRTWVDDNLQSHPITARGLATQLSYQGKVVKTPAEALTLAEKITTSWFSSKKADITRYQQSLDGILNKLMKAVTTAKTEDAKSAAMQAAADEVADIKRPIPSDSEGPMFLAGKQFIMRKTGYGSFSAQDDYKANTDTLPSLVTNDIIAAAQLLLKQLDVIDSLTLPVLGSEMNEPWWHIEDDGAVYRMEENIRNKPEQQSRAFSEYIRGWRDVMFAVAKWLHSSCADSKETVAMESLDLAAAFDGTHPNPSDRDAMVGLFGTVNSDWRERIIPMLKTNYFNPIVDDWTPEAQAQEELIKQTASGILFVISPKQKGFFSFVELTEFALQSPDRMFVCILDNDDNVSWDADAKKSIDAVRKFLTDKTDVTVYTTLEDVANAINTKVPNISRDGTAGTVATNPEGGGSISIVEE